MCVLCMFALGDHIQIAAIKSKCTQSMIIIIINYTRALMCDGASEGEVYAHSQPSGNSI